MPIPRSSTVILANGVFPTHPTPRAALRTAQRIVCCDGAVRQLLAATGQTPAAIVGDLDSLPTELQTRFHDIVHRDTSQDDNDLAKAFRFCLSQNWRQIVILGATGLREDHTLGNLGWLVDFALQADVTLLTDTGVFTAVHQGNQLPCHPGQQVSFFTLNGQTTLNAHGLRYPVNQLRPTRWWQATLNEACGTQFEIHAAGGPVLVFQSYA
jgi:thiamine pyrophosphokinase